MADETSRGEFNTKNLLAATEKASAETPLTSYSSTATIGVRFSGLFGDQPSLPNFPPAIKVLSVFAKLLEEQIVTQKKKDPEREKVLTLKLVNYFNAQRTTLTNSKKFKDYHIAASILQTELQGVEEIIDNYLDLSLSHPIDFAKGLFQLIPKPLKVGQSFKEIANRGFFRVFAETFDRVEQQLTNLDFDISFPHVDVMINLPQLNEYIAWRRIVRLRLVACLLTSLSYNRIWKAVDGDAGWYLSNRISEIADYVTKRLVFQDFERQVYGNDDTFLLKTGYKRLLDDIMEIKKIPVRAAEWRDYSKVHGCSVSEIGEKYPYEFPKLHQALYLLPGMKEGKFPHMHARKAAQTRLFLVKEYWEYVREQMINKNKFDSEKTEHFLFSIGAATLLHGGAHPPHISHRNGAQFDLDLTYLPDLTAPQALLNAIPTADPFPTENEAQDGEPLADDRNELTLPAYGMEVPSAVLWRTPSKQRGAHHLTEEHNKPLWTELIIKFMQCLLLSFPRFILYASRDYYKAALENLIAKIEDDVRPFYEAEDDKHTVEALKAMIEIWKKVGFDPRRDHHNHWHVNYDPDGLGNENDKITSANPELNRQIEQLQEVLHQPDIRKIGAPLWQWLLEELENN